MPILSILYEKRGIGIASKLPLAILDEININYPCLEITYVITTIHNHHIHYSHLCQIALLTPLILSTFKHIGHTVKCSLKPSSSLSSLSPLPCPQTRRARAATAVSAAVVASTAATPRPLRSWPVPDSFLMLPTFRLFLASAMMSLFPLRVSLFLKPNAPSRLSAVARSIRM